MKLAFIIWTLLCLLFVFLAFRTSRSKEPVSFWANETSELKIDNVKEYNSKLAKLFLVYAVLLFICGLPLLTESKLAVIGSVLGTVFSSFGMMAYYVMKIESKYRK
jgi:hypothetical protein